MTNYLILTCWNQKQRYTGINEYYKSFKEVCNLYDGVKFNGLFKPLHESWHWAFLYHVNSLETWEKVEEEIDRRYSDKEENISQKTSRIYVERSSNPMLTNLENMKYLEIELYRWKGIDIGLKDYYNALVNFFKGKNDVWFMGHYMPANEDYNWVNFFQYESITHIDEMDDEMYRAIGRPENQQIVIEKLYKRYTPVEKK